MSSPPPSSSPPTLVPALTKGFAIVDLVAREPNPAGQAWQETAAAWLDKMGADEVLPDLIQSRRVPYRAEDHRMVKAREDMFTILPQMESASIDDPMRRSSCDEVGRGACVFQPYCWSPTPVEMDDLDYLFRRRELDPQTPSEAPRQ